MRTSNAWVLTSVLALACNTTLGQGKYESFDSGVRSLAEQLVANVADKAALAKAKVAVGSFPDSTHKVSEFSWRVSEALIVELQKTQAFGAVLERSQLEHVLKEQGGNMSAAFDETQVAKLGQLLGAQFLVLGSIASPPGLAGNGREAPARIR